MRSSKVNPSTGKAVSANKKLLNKIAKLEAELKDMTSKRDELGELASRCYKDMYDLLCGITAITSTVKVLEGRRGHCQADAEWVEELRK